MACVAPGPEGTGGLPIGAEPSVKRQRIEPPLSASGAGPARGHEQGGAWEDSHPPARDRAPAQRPAGTPAGPPAQQATPAHALPSCGGLAAVPSAAAAAAAVAAAAAAVGVGVRQPAAAAPQPPDVRAALAELGLSAKELFAGNGVTLPPVFTEAKMGELLQQLWVWAIHLGKVAIDAPVTVPRLVLVAQWGLQRMRDGAVQGRDSAAAAAAAPVQHEAPPQAKAAAAPPAGLAQRLGRGEVACRQAAAAAPPARDLYYEASINPAGIGPAGAAATAPPELQLRCARAAQQQAPAEQQQQQQQQALPQKQPLPPPPQQQQQQQQQAEPLPVAGSLGRNASLSSPDGSDTTTTTTATRGPQQAAPNVQPPSEAGEQEGSESSSSDDEETQDDSALERGAAALASLASTRRAGGSRVYTRDTVTAVLTSWIAALQSRTSASAGQKQHSMSAQQEAGAEDAESGAVQRPRPIRALPSASFRGLHGPQPPASATRLPLLGSPPANAAFQPFSSGSVSLPPTPRTSAAERGAGASQADMLYLLGDLTGAELAEQPAFTGALQEVLHTFDTQLAVRRIPFRYTPGELRQACAFVVRHLDALQKRWLAQDTAELFFVVLQACGLVQHMEHKVAELHQSVSRKVARIANAAALVEAATAAVAAGAGAGAVMQQARGGGLARADSGVAVALGGQRPSGVWTLPGSSGAGSSAPAACDLHTIGSWEVHMGTLQGAGLSGRHNAGGLAAAREAPPGLQKPGPGSVGAEAGGGAGQGKDSPGGKGSMVPEPQAALHVQEAAA